MTVTAPGRDAGDVHGRIREAACRMPVVWTGDRLTPNTIADALLPVVEEMLDVASREAAAKTLEALAAEMAGAVRLARVPFWETAAKLRDRAAALRADLPSGDAG